MQYVVAGTGYTGRRVIAALQASAGISRRKPPEISDSRFFARDLDCADLAEIRIREAYSLLYTVPPPGDASEDLRLARLLNALQLKPSRIVYLSTSGVYGDHAGALIDESTPARPAQPRSWRRWQAERQLANFSANAGCELVVLRVPGIYGPGRLGIDRIREQQPVLRESDAGPGNRIHVDDLAACCIAAMRPENPAGIYNVGDGDFRSSTWFSLRVAELAGLTAPPQVSRREAESSFSAMRLSFLDESRRLNTARMRDVLGVEPKYDNPEAGIRASLLAEGGTSDR